RSYSCSQAWASGILLMSKTALISALSAPWRTLSLVARSPRVSPRASSRIDLPAPVSPLMTVMPGSNCRSICSAMAKSRTESWRSIRRHPGDFYVYLYSIFHILHKNVLWRLKAFFLTPYRAQTSINLFTSFWETRDHVGRHAERRPEAGTERSARSRHGGYIIGTRE